MRRPGFHAADLVVVLACLGLCGALLAPAMVRSQEQANRMKCANNLKILAIAAHNYHADYDRLPPGYIGPQSKEKGPLARLDKPEDSLNVGSLVFLLPYLEQEQVFKALKDTSSPGNDPLKLDPKSEAPAWWRREENVQVSRSNLQALLRCPSDSWEDAPSSILAAFHCADGTMEQHVLPGKSAFELGRTNYTGVAGTFGPCQKQWDMFRGVYTNRSKLTLGQLSAQDGTSNTLMFGEGLGGKTPVNRGTAWSWIGVGTMATRYGLDRNPTENTAYRFGSKHEKVVQFAYCDGSVRGVRFGKTAEMPNPMPESLNNLPVTDWLILQQLAGYKDGLNNDTSAIVD